MRGVGRQTDGQATRRTGEQAQHLKLIWYLSQLILSADQLQVLRMIHLPLLQLYTRSPGVIKGHSSDKHVTLLQRN